MQDDARLYALARVAQDKAVKARRRRRKTAAPAVDAAEPTWSPTQRRGRSMEDRACRHLQARGLVMLERNLSCKAGEIDLVARDANVLVFIEVRYRHTQRYGGGAASVDGGKQQRLIFAAKFFLPRLARRHFAGHIPACRFDVVSIRPAGLTWIKAAFSE